MTETRQDRLRQALRAAWSAETCHPDDRVTWAADRAARGQCGTTALVVQDYLGGEIVVGHVIRDGDVLCDHWWNRVDATDLDFTVAGLRPDETVADAAVVGRDHPAIPIFVDEYRELRARVERRLGPPPLPG